MRTRRAMHEARSSRIRRRMSLGGVALSLVAATAVAGTQLGTGAAQATGTTTQATTAAAFHGYGYLPTTADNSLNVFDTRTNTFVKKVAIGTRPAFAKVTPDGSKVFVSTFTSSNSYVAVYETATGAVHKIPVNGFVWGLEMSSNGAYVYIATSANTYQVIDTASETVVQTVKLGGSPIGIALSPDDNTLYLAFQPGLVSAYDLYTNTLVHKAISVNGLENLYIIASADGTKLYSLNWITSNVTVIDTRTWKVVKNIDTGWNSEPLIATNSPDGKSLWVTDYGTHNVKVVNEATDTVTATITTPGTPIVVQFTRDGQQAYVVDAGKNSSLLPSPVVTTLLQLLIPLTGASTGPGQVIPINLTTNTLGTGVPTGGDPLLLAFGPAA